MPRQYLREVAIHPGGRPTSGPCSGSRSLSRGPAMPANREVLPLAAGSSSFGGRDAVRASGLLDAQAHSRSAAHRIAATYGRKCGASVSRASALRPRQVPPRRRGGSAARCVQGGPEEFNQRRLYDATWARATLQPEPLGRLQRLEYSEPEPRRQDIVIKRVDGPWWAIRPRSQGSARIRDMLLVTMPRRRGILVARLRHARKGADD